MGGAMEVGVVLMRPEKSGNIGAVCRAMASAGLRDLRIVGEKKDYNQDEVLKFALKAAEIWERAKFFSPGLGGLMSAISDYQIAFSTTRRLGKKRAATIQSLSECVGWLGGKAFSKVAFVFGNERTGLSQEELALCNSAVYIPTSSDFGSLNLSHAVQIVCYELFKSRGAGAKLGLAGARAELGRRPNEIATLDEVFRLSENILSTLQADGFFKVGGAEENKVFFRNILARAGLSQFELEHIQQILEKLAQKRKGK